MKELNDIFLSNFNALKYLFYKIKKHLKLFIFIMIIILNVNVFAQDFNATNTITAPTCTQGTNCTGGHYTGLENYNAGIQSVYATNTRYNGRLGAIRFNLPLPTNWPDGECFSGGDLTYKLTLNMATEDWRNHFARPFISSWSGGTNYATSNMVFVSQKKVYFNFKIPSSASCLDFLYVYLQSPNQASTSFTGVNNWNLSNVTLSVDFPSSPIVTPAPVVTTTPKPDSSNADIIKNQNQNTTNIINNQNQNTTNITNNQNQNTTSIINNQNQNTQDMIENNNQNTQSIIDNNNNNLNDCFKSFSNNIMKIGKGYNTAGNLILRPTSLYSDIYKIEPSSTITVTNGVSSTTNLYVLFDENMNFIDYYYLRDRSTAVPSNARYFAMSKTDYGIEVSINTGFCTSKLDKVSSSIDDLNNTISNDNIDNGVGSNFFNDFSSQDNGGISGIITKPLVLINSLLSNNSSCNNLTFGIKFPNMENKNVSLPSGCILWNNVPSNVVSIYHIFIVGFCSYYLLRRLFKDVEDLKNPEKDNVEVIDL